MLRGAAGGVRTSARNILSGSARSTSDIRPLPHRPRIRYAGHMCAAPTPPIDRVYGTAKQVLNSKGILVPWSREAVYGL